MSTLELSFQAELKQNNNCLFDHSLAYYYFEKFKQGEFHDVDDLAKLLFLSGAYQSVIQFCLLVMELRKPVIESTFPWHYLVESIYRLEPFPSAELKNSLHQLNQQLSLDELFARSPHARKLVPTSHQTFDDWNQNAEDKYDQIKSQYLQELKQAELEGSMMLEDQIIQKLSRIDPLDAAIANYKKKLQERRALEVLAQRKTYSTFQPISDLADAEVGKLYLLIKNQMLQTSEASAETALDFAVALLQWGEYADAQTLLSLAPASEEKDWMLCELLLLQNKYVELLALLPHVEVTYAHLAHTFFHTSYLRALCYHGLGQKETAMEILEALTTTAPDYRDATILMMQWRSE